MSLSYALLNLLRCPETGAELSLSEGELTTAHPGQHYPLIEGIPWLLPNPANSLVDWSIKLNHLYETLHSEIEQLQVALGQTRGATRARLQQLSTAKQLFLPQLMAIMAPVVRSPRASQASYDALHDRAPASQQLLSYEANLYRDWVWGHRENQLSLEIVRTHAGQQLEGALLVLGAGAGRLAVDCHRRLRPDMTVATEINPFPFLILQRLLAGHALTLQEFPLHPRSNQWIAIEQKLQPVSISQGFHLVFSDALKPAFAPGAFNTVLTPWLIDIQPLTLSRLLQQLNQYLPVGGQWINFGSLVFEAGRDALCYGIEEVKALAAQQGFALEPPQQHEIPYLQSPYNAGYRMEHIWSWRAIKTAGVAPLKDTQILPQWLLDTRQPIPKASYWQQLISTHRTYAQLVASVDGRTSIHQLAKTLARQQSMDLEEARTLTRQLFIDFYRQFH